MALVSIRCEACGHTGAVPARALPAFLTCAGCGSRTLVKQDSGIESPAAKPLKRTEGDDRLDDLESES